MRARSPAISALRALPLQLASYMCPCPVLLFCTAGAAKAWPSMNRKELAAKASLSLSFALHFLAKRHFATPDAISPAWTVRFLYLLAFLLALHALSRYKSLLCIGGAPGRAFVPPAAPVLAFLAYGALFVLECPKTSRRWFFAHILGANGRFCGFAQRNGTSELYLQIIIYIYNRYCK